MPSPPRSTVPVLFTALAGFFLFSCQEKEPVESPLPPVAPSPPPPRPVSYNFEVRPLLAQKCFGCHGRDQHNNESGLRLDSAEFAYHPLGEDHALDRHAFVPGEREQSVAWQRIHSEKDDEIMPPPDAGPALTESDREILGLWIDQGARYEPHWAFQPLTAQGLDPGVSTSEWPRNRIDHFVLAALEKSGLSPASEADPTTLSRRLSLALTGYPPILDHEFVASSSTVDELLASPAFGEHFASLWLDAVGYADTSAPDSDALTNRWAYRDWVVESFNRNMPYDEFLTAQLAGDLVEAQRHDHTVATAFNRLQPLATASVQSRPLILAGHAASRASNLGPILGLSLHCARCHDHKSEPISHADFQSLAGFFKLSDEHGLRQHPSIVPAPTKPLPTNDQLEILHGVQASVDTAVRRLREEFVEGNQAFQDWLREPLQTPVINDAIGTFTFDERKRVVPNHALSGAGSGDATGLKFSTGFSRSAVTFPGDAGVTFHELYPARRWTPWTFTLRLRAPDLALEPVVLLSRGRGSIDGLRGLDLLLDHGHLIARLAREWPGNAIAIRTVAPVVTPHYWHLVTWSYDGSSSVNGLKLYLDGKQAPTEVIADSLWKPVLLEEDKSLPLQLGWRPGTRGFAGGAIDDFQVHSRDLTSLEIATLYDGNSLSTVLANFTEHLPALRSYYFSSLHPGTRTLRAKLAELRKASILPEDDVFEISVMKGTPDPSTTLPSFLQPQTSILPSTAKPPGVDGQPESPLTRRDLAASICNHPLTARVFVNRIWAHFFGRGLVESIDDFGLRSPAPSHPELLDWLARDFVHSGWDVKRLCKQIVLSATFRQDSTLLPEVSLIDPTFRLLAQGPSFPLSGPQARDYLLASAGVLEEGTGGAPQSPGIQPLRRSLYLVHRHAPPRPMRKDPDRCPIDHRQPAHLAPRPSLTEEESLLASRALAIRILGDHSTDSQRLHDLYLRLLGRPPTEVEAAELQTELETQKVHFSPDDPNAPQLVHPGESSLDPAATAAWTALIQSDLIPLRAIRQR